MLCNKELKDKSVNANTDVKALQKERNVKINS